MKERFILCCPSFGVALCLGLSLTGCGKVASVLNFKPKPKKAPPKPLETAATKKASGTRYSDPKAKVRERLWVINWEAANLSFNDGGAFSGQMRAVTGDIFQSDEVTTTFSADQGLADKVTSHLTLSGNVVLRSKAYKSVLTAEKIDWLPETKMIKATGNVFAEGDWGVIGPVDALYANAKLTRFGTQNNFQGVANK